MNNSILIALVLYLALISCNEKREVDTIIYGAKVYTCDSAFKTVEAVAIKDGLIVLAEEKQTVNSLYNAKKIINASGKYIYPGFIDAHCHFSGYAHNKYMCELRGTSSFQDVINKVIAYEKQNNLAWIYGRGWDQNDWSDKEYPTKEILDSLFPNKPVILRRVDGHALLCNQVALNKAGITTTTIIEGGIIEKKNGQLTGILVDNAANPVLNNIPGLNKDQAETYYLQAEQDCFKEGLTMVVDCGVKANKIKQLQSLYEENKLHIANAILLDQEDETINQYVSNGFYKKGQFQINGIKLYADGALGSRGARLIKEYSDKHGHYGMMLTDTAKMNLLAKLSIKHELQLCTHAIGDSANHAILRLYSNFLEKGNDKRWRIEHAQVVDNQYIKLYSEYKIIPSVQPTHAISDMSWALYRLGKDRLPTAYAYKELLNQNGWIALGTDFPVEEISPLATFYTAVARKDKNGFPEKGFLIENALSRKEALYGMTTWAAKSVFWEKEKGSIEVGKHADLIILDRDIMTIPEEDILETKVEYTIVKGEIVYIKKEAE